MRKAGRPHKIITEDMLKRRAVSVARVRDAMERATPRITQEDLAERLGIHRTTVGDYLNPNGTAIIPWERARDIAQLLGSHADYWLGITDTKDPRAYTDELEEAGFWSRVDYEERREAAQREARRQAKLQQYQADLNSMFGLFGYLYEPYEADEGGPQVLLTKVSADSLTDYELTRDELRELLNELRSTVDYVCYKFQQRKRQ